MLRFLALKIPFRFKFFNISISRHMLKNLRSPPQVYTQARLYYPPKEIQVSCRGPARRERVTKRGAQHNTSSVSHPSNTSTYLHHRFFKKHTHSPTLVISLSFLSNFHFVLHIDLPTLLINKWNCSPLLIRGLQLDLQLDLQLAQNSLISFSFSHVPYAQDLR